MFGFGLNQSYINLIDMSCPTLFRGTTNLLFIANDITVEIIVIQPYFFQIAHYHRERYDLVYLTSDGTINPLHIRSTRQTNSKRPRNNTLSIINFFSLLID